MSPWVAKAVILAAAIVLTPVFSIAEYPLRVVPFVAGVACLAISLWVFYRSHADLGTNWSVSLELRESHQLIAHGIYRNIRHPIYTALLLYGVGQSLVVPNWIAGPSYLVAMAILVALRVGAEERMMLATFPEYAAYLKRTKRLVPYTW